MSSGYLELLEARRVSAQSLRGKRVSKAVLANIALSVDDPWIQWLAPDAARNVNMPTESSSEGAVMLIVNNSAGANTLTMQSSAGAALSPAVTILQNKAALMVCDGTAWRALSGA